MSSEFLAVGKRLPRVDGAEKAAARAIFTADIKLLGMLVGKVLRSPYPHAKILKVDASRAEELPGVEAVITAKDVPAEAFTRTMWGVMLAGGSKELRDEHIFADKARFVGDPVAAIAAIDEFTAQKGLELVDIEYEPLPAVFDPLEAMKPGSPQIHDFAQGNVAAHMRFPTPVGDVKKGLEEADYIIEETFRTSNQKHCQMEPNACIASFDPTGRLTIWSPCQLAHPARTKLAQIFNIPEGMVRWITPSVGGGFGQRLTFANELICVALAQKTGRPVKIEDTREEDFVARGRHTPFINTGKIGVKADGTITALQARVVANAGAYYTHSGIVSGSNMRFFLTFYRCANISGEADVVYTNAPPSGGMRGWGNPAAMVTLEQLIDMAAETIGMDPVEFRLKNIKKTGEPMYHSLPIENSALDECIKVGAERIGWKEKRARRKDGTIRQGVGMACTTHSSSAWPMLLEHSNAFMKLNADGSVNLIISPCEMGQGILGVLAQIAAEEMGLLAEDIHVVTGDTDITLFDIGSHATRSTYVIGNAVLRAARDAKNQLLERAAKTLVVSPGELEARNRQIYVKVNPEKKIAIAEVARNAIYNFEGNCLNITGKCSFEPKQSNPFQAVFAEVEVDTETGVVRVLRIVTAVDCGRAINPMNVEGQFEGGAAQGVGYTLTEDYVVDPETGVLITDNFNTYWIPRTLDLPEIEVVIVEQPVASGPFGAKGVGELATVGIAPAISNAIYNAVGVRVKEFPMTPERVLSALKEREKAEKVTR